MPRYFFDLTEGARLEDPFGLDCHDDDDARAKAKVIASQIARDASHHEPPRRIAVLNANGARVSTGPVEPFVKGDK